MDEAEAESQAFLRPAFLFLSYVLSVAEQSFSKIPGSAVVARYVRSSHQNDPGRTLLELILVLVLIRTILQSRTRADNSGKHFIEFDEKVRHRVSLAAPGSDAFRLPGN